MFKRAVFVLLKWLRYRLVFPGLAILPVSIGYRLANLIGILDARLQVTRRAVARGVSIMFPGLAVEPRGLRLLLRQYYQMMARDMLDCFCMPGFTQDNVRDHLTVKGVEKLVAAREAGRGVIMIISHFGRFFMLGPGLKFAGVEFGMFTTMVDERHPSYDSIDRWYMATKLRNTQFFSRGTWVTTGDDIRKLYRTLQSGEIMLFALDGNETVSKSRIEFPFCGGVLSLPEGIVRVAKRTGAKLIYAAAVDKGIGVEIRIHDLPDEPLAGLAAAISLLEQDLLAAPWQWWQWPGLGALWRSGQRGNEKDAACT